MYFATCPDAAETIRDHGAMPQRHPEVLFRNGTVFDGGRFLPAGTCVRVRGGRITGVGPDPDPESLGPGSAEPVDLAGGTLLPGFIDAHAHPVFAGHQ